jgi:AcrR family transcriptional regulator
MAGERLDGRRLFEHPLGEAVMEVLAERGYEAASVEEFVRRAGISRAEFERHFSGKAEATLRVYEAFIDDFVARVQRVYDAAPPWPANLRAAAYEVTRWMADHPAATQFGNVGIFAAEEIGRVRREELFRWCASLIDAGRKAAPDPDVVPAGAPLLVVGAVVEISRRHQEGGFGGDPVGMVPELMYGAVRPYLGDEAARHELHVPPPPDLAEGRR